MYQNKLSNSSSFGLHLSETNMKERRQALSRELKEVRKLLLLSQTHERRNNRNLMGFNLR